MIATYHYISTARLVKVSRKLLRYNFCRKIFETKTKIIFDIFLTSTGEDKWLLNIPVSKLAIGKRKWQKLILELLESYNSSSSVAWWMRWTGSRKESSLSARYSVISARYLITTIAKTTWVPPSQQPWIEGYLKDQIANMLISIAHNFLLGWNNSIFQSCRQYRNMIVIRSCCLISAGYDVIAWLRCVPMHIDHLEVKIALVQDSTMRWSAQFISPWFDVSSL